MLKIVGDEREWVDQPDNVLEFAQVLSGSGLINTAAGMLRYFEKPWKWTAVFLAWDRAGRPDQIGDQR